MGEEYKRDISIVGMIPTLGPIVLFDDMEGLLKWDKDGTGTGYDVTKDDTVAYYGNSCLKMVTRAATPGVNDQVQAKRRLYQMPPGRYRVEMIFMCPDWSKVGKIEVYSQAWTAVGTWVAAMQYDGSTNKWMYNDSGGEFAEVPGGSQNLKCANAWHRMAFEYDRIKGEYIRLTSDSLEIDLRGVGMYTDGGAAEEHRIWIIGYTAIAAQATLYLDNVLVKTI